MKHYELISQILKYLSTMVKPGVTPMELESWAEETILSHKAVPFNKNYHPEWATKPYPNVLCISVNNVIAHGIPSNVPFRDGDIVNIDTALIKDGHCADAALTVGVGKISHADQNLIRFTKRTIYAGIQKIKAGVTNWDIAEAMYHTAVYKYNYNVNLRFSGHGIGRSMHEAPKIPCFKLVANSQDEVHVPKMELKAGQVVCLEPFLTRSKDLYGDVASDGWTCSTYDNKNVAMFEHMVLVTEKGHKVLTTHFDEK